MTDQTLAEQAIVSPVNVQEFSKKVKEKYPEYKDVDDLTLAQKIVEKYPEYKDRVSFDQPEATGTPQPTEQPLTYMQKELRQRFPENYKEEPQSERETSYIPEVVENGKALVGSIPATNPDLSAKHPEYFAPKISDSYQSEKPTIIPEGKGDKFQAIDQKQFNSEIGGAKIVQDQKPSPSEDQSEWIKNNPKLNTIFSLPGMGIFKEAYIGTKKAIGGLGTTLDVITSNISNSITGGMQVDESGNILAPWEKGYNQDKSEFYKNVRKFEEQAPVSSGGATAFLGQLLPQTAALAATVLLRSPNATKAYLASMYGSSFGNGVESYDDYIKETGKQENPEDRYLVGMGYGAAEYIGEKVGLDYFMPKGYGKLLAKSLDASPSMAKEIGQSVLENYAKLTKQSLPSILKKLAISSQVEGGQEVATEIMDIAIDKWLTGKDVSGQEIKDRLLQSYGGGALMGAGIAPFAHVSQNSASTQRRRDQGSVAISIDEDGLPVELIKTKDKVIGIRPDGEEVQNISQATIDKSATFKTKIFEAAIKEFSKTNKITTATIEGQQYTINNPEDLGIEGKPIFAKDAEGNVIPVSGKKKDLIADVVTQTQGELDQAQQAAADQQALMNGIADPNAQIVNEVNEDGIRLVKFSNGQSKIITPEGEHIANDKNEEDTILEKIINGEPIEPKPEGSSTEPSVNTEPKYPLDKDGNPDVDQMDEVQMFNYNTEIFGIETAIADLQGDIQLYTDKIIKAEKKLTTADTKTKIKTRIEIQKLQEQKAKLEQLIPQIPENVNIESSTSENVPEISEAPIDNQAIENVDNQNNSQNNQLQNEESKKVDQQPDGIIANEGENTTQAQQGQGNEKGLEENVIPVDENTIQGLNESEIAFIQEKINDPEEDPDQKEWWADDIKDLQTDPAKYWNAFAVDIKGQENDPRVKQIKSIQEFYNVSTDQPVVESLTADPVAEFSPEEIKVEKANVKKSKQQAKQISPEEAKQRKIDREKALSIEPSTIEQLVLQYIAAGNRLNWDEIKREVFPKSDSEMKQRIWMLKKDGKTIDNLLGLLNGTQMEEEGNQPNVFRNTVIDAVLRNGTRTQMVDRILEIGDQNQKVESMSDFELGEALQAREQEERNNELAAFDDLLAELENNGELPSNNDLIELFLSENIEENGQETNPKGSIEPDGSISNEGSQGNRTVLYGDNEGKDSSTSGENAVKEGQKAELTPIEKEIVALNKERSELLSQKVKTAKNVNARNGLFGDIAAKPGDLFEGQGFDASEAQRILKNIDDRITVIDQTIYDLTQKAADVKATAEKENAGQQKLVIPEVEAKEPWQMTREEYINENIKGLKGYELNRKVILLNESYQNAIDKKAYSLDDLAENSNGKEYRKDKALFWENEVKVPKISSVSEAEFMDNWVNSKARPPLNNLLEDAVKAREEKKQSTPLPEEKQAEVRFRILGDPRSGLTNVRGSWTKAKIIKELKEIKKNNSGYGKFGLLKGIASFENAQDLRDHLFYHGTGSGVSGALYPSITISEREAEQSGGGGYGQRYFAVSVSKSKRKAASFSGQSRSISVYPVILNKEANVIDRPDLQDSNELDDIIEELWNNKVDAVRLGDWNDNASEMELAVINPNAISTWSGSDSRMVYGMKLADFKEKTDEELEQIIDQAKSAIIKFAEWEAENKPKLDEFPAWIDGLTIEQLNERKQTIAERKKIRDEYNQLKGSEQRKLTEGIRFRVEEQSQIIQNALNYSDVNDFIDAYKDADFRDSHSAPGNSMSDMSIEERMDQGDDFNLTEVVQGFSVQPKDYFDPRNGARWYGYDDKEGMQSYYAIKSVMSDVNGQIERNGKIIKMPKIKAYRAVPKGVEVNDLIDGDWITFSKEYAKGHGENRFGQGEYKIISQNIPANEVWWDGNDINEWGYDTGKTENLGRSDLKAIWENAHAANRFRILGETGAANLDRAEEVTTRLDNLAIAREMETSGKDAKTISLATGWEKGVDGKWRYEVPEGKMVSGRVGHWFLPEIYEDPELYAAYPQIRDLDVVIARNNGRSVRGSFNGNVIYIYADDLKQANSTLNHEIQHAIQDIEGFAKGGSPENGLNLLRNELIQKVSNLPKYKELTDKRESLIKGGNSIFSKEVEDIEKERDLFLVKYASQLTKEGTWEAAKYEAYKRLAGETESRNVQTRMNMTPEERRNALLSETEDVAREDQIVLMDGLGVSSLEESNPIQSTIDHLQSTDRNPRKVNFDTKENLIQYMKDNDYPQSILDQVKLINFGGVLIRGEIFMDSGNVNTTDKAVINWLHERTHVQTAENMTRPELVDFYHSIGPKEIRRVIPSFYWNKPYYEQADEYISYASEGLSTYGELDQNIPEHAKEIITNIVSGFTSPKNLKDATKSNNLDDIQSGNTRRNVRRGNNDGRGNQESEGTSEIGKAADGRSLPENEKRSSKGLTVSTLASQDLSKRHNASNIITKLSNELGEEISVLNSSELAKNSKDSVVLYDNGKLTIVSDRIESVSGVVKSILSEVAAKKGLREVLVQANPDSNIGRQLPKFDELNADLSNLKENIPEADRLAQIFRKAFSLTSGQFSNSDLLNIVKDQQTRLRVTDENKSDVSLGEKPMTIDELKADKSVFWHGSPSGDMRGGAYGLHIGTHEAAKQALEARIGVKADGTDWDGTTEYGKTLIAGKKTLSKPENEYRVTGYNSGRDIPENDYYPSERDYKATYGDRSVVSETSRPSIQPVKIIGEMSNYPSNPHEDFKANGYMKAAITKGNAKRGYYYNNVGEDSGSISAVVPNANHIEVIPFSKEKPNTILINGVSRSTLNSNGKPIANSEEGIRNFWKWFGDSKAVDAEGRPLVVSLPDSFSPVLSGKSSMPKSSMDSLGGYAKFITDLFKSKAFIDQGLSGFNIPTQDIMLESMIRLGDNKEIVNSIIEFIPVNVMNFLRSKKLSADMLFHDKAMLKKVFTVNTDASIPVTIDIPNSLAVAITDVIAKIPSTLSDKVFSYTKDGSTKGTSDVYLLSNNHDDNVLFANVNKFNDNIKLSGNNGSFSPESNDIRFRVEQAVEDLNKINSLPKSNLSDLLKSVNETVEASMAEAHGIKATPLWERIKAKLIEIKESTQHFQHITEDEFPVVYDKLRQFEAIPDRVKKEAYERISEVIRPITKNQQHFEAFERYIVLQDLVNDIENTELFANKDLPWGYSTVDEIKTDMRNVRTYVMRNPAVLKAVRDRQAMMKEVKQALVDNKLLKDNGNDKYFHHQVLAYMEGQVFPGVSSKDVRNHKKGWQRSRQGSIAAYNTNYLESEFEVLAQSLEQVAIKNILGELGAKTNIMPDLIKQAKQMGGSWRDYIPEGYKQWFPKQGTNAYKAASMAEKAVQNILNDPNSPDVAQFIAEVEGNMWVIPEPVAKQLDSMKDPEKEMIFPAALRLLTGKWKQWILLNPYSAIKYNFNNMSGDLDVVMAYDPTILKPKYAKTATTEAWNNLRGKGMSEDMKEALQYGIITSGLSIQEIPDVNQQTLFKSVTKGSGNIAQKLWGATGGKYWGSITDMSQFRENVLRLASYKFFKEQTEAGKKPLGASDKKAIDALYRADTNPKEIAGKLARELMGDYGNLSQAGQWFRSHSYPFWSWVEINSPRYYRLLKNTKFEDNTGTLGRVAAVGAAKTALNVGKLGIKAMLLMGLVVLWNRLMFPDEDDELQKQKDHKLKLIVGRREDGSIMTMKIQGAFSDMLSFFGLEDAVTDANEISEGKSTIGKKVAEGGSALVNKFAQGAMPLTKTLGEVITKKSFYPDILNPRPVRDRAEQGLRIFKMDQIYNYLTHKPARSFGKEVSGLLVYDNSPGEAAYYTMRQNIFDFMKDNGEEFPSGEPTDRSNALYYYKQSLKLGDPEKASFWFEKYKELGGTAKGYTASMKKGMIINTIPNDLKAAWYKSLDAEDKEVLDMANKWYFETYLKVGIPKKGIE